jgi:hypothetical protein
MWSYRLVDETGSRLELVIDGEGANPPKLVDVGVRLERERDSWVCARLVQHGPYDWRPSTDLLFCDGAGKPLDASQSDRRASSLDSEIKRIAELLQRFREHVEGLAMSSPEDTQTATVLAALDSQDFAARTKRGAAKVDPTSEYVACNTPAQARYRDRLRAGLKRLPPPTGEEREELAWPARVWRRRTNDAAQDQISPDEHPQ